MVQIEALDDNAAAHDLPGIHIFKLDLQGFESKALAGARRLLSQHQISFIYAEVSFSLGDSEMQEFSSRYRLIESAGYRLCGFYEPFRWGHAQQFHGFCNALFIRPEALALAASRRSPA